MFQITDWTGRICFNGQTFDTAEDASGYLSEHLHKAHPNATDDEFDAIIGEFYINQINK